MFKWFKKWRANQIKDEHAREKTLAEIDNEPWVKVLDIEFDDPQKPSVGGMVLDWNTQFIDMLKENGYSGRTEDRVVDMWLRDVCRGILADENN